MATQYASFLAAVGGVSITVLALILNLRNKPKAEALRFSRVFLITALIVATVSCFVGAHMLVETAAAISYARNVPQTCNNQPAPVDCVRETFPGFNAPQDCENMQNPDCVKKMWAKLKEETSGQRLFLLASTNIFISALLVLFALMLLPTASSESNRAITPISILVYALVTTGIIVWMALGGFNRMQAANLSATSAWTVAFSLICFFAVVAIPRKYLLLTTFFTSIVFTVGSFLCFALTFDNSGKASDLNIFFFGTAVLSTYLSLFVAGFKIMFPIIFCMSAEEQN